MEGMDVKLHIFYARHLMEVILMPLQVLLPGVQIGSVTGLAPGAVLDIAV
jgi:hypothetical protein